MTAPNNARVPRWKLKTAPLSRKAEVIEVLRAGGAVRAVQGRPAIVRLEDRDGNDVPAWQQAIHAGLKAFNREDAAQEEDA